MKLSPRDAGSYLKNPDPARAGILIYGADPMRVATRRQTLIEATIGPDGDAEMRLSRMTGAELRSDPAGLSDALKAVGFFPGARVAFVEGATDSTAPVIEAALADWREGDAQLVITAGSLTPRSALRKLFEKHPNAFCLAVYNDPPSRAEISDDLKKHGLVNLSNEGMDAIFAAATDLDPGELRQTLAKLALYKIGDDTPLSPEDVANCMPAQAEAQTDDLINAAASGQHGQIGPLVRRLQAQGTQPVFLCITAMRHFRQLHTAAADPGGAGPGVGKLRPPVFEPRRDQMIRQAQQWGTKRLEAAIALLIDIDLTLRSSSNAPQMAVLERGFIRLAMMGKQR